MYKDAIMAYFDNFILIKDIEQGSFGKVCMVDYNGEKLAAKYQSILPKRAEQLPSVLHTDIKVSRSALLNPMPILEISTLTCLVDVRNIVPLRGFGFNSENIITCMDLMKDDLFLVIIR